LYCIYRDTSGSIAYFVRAAAAARDVCFIKEAQLPQR